MPRDTFLKRIGAALVVFVGLVAWSQMRPSQVAPLPPAAAPQPAAAPTLTPIPVTADAVPQNGWFGYSPNPRASAAFVGTLPKRTLREAAPQLFGYTGDDTVLLYRALLEIRPDWIVGTQQIGDCVSWGWGHGADILLAVDYKLGRTGEWASACTEAIYGGSRVEARGRTFGGWSDGSYGAAAAKWVRDWGIVHRKVYAEVNADLTRYSGERAKNWGAYGCGGQDDGGRLDAVAKRHPIRTVVLVTNFDEAAAAIRNGYPVPVCSGQGFAKQRDQDGFAAPSGSWSHCMCFIGVRGAPRPGLLCLNSWGPNWIRGPTWPSDQPAGSFWVDVQTVNRMLAGRDSYAVSSYLGFPRRKLNHSEGW